MTFTPAMRVTTTGARVKIHPESALFEVSIYKMGLCAEDSWCKLRGFRHLAKVIEGVKFKDGIEVTEDDKATA